MCGVAGALWPDAAAAGGAVAAMCAQMVPRGPDDGGVETFAARGGAVSLGSRRLAIIDPSPAGHQPMSDPERGTTIVYNGMIYNFADLRAELASAGERFRSDCDTEVILRAYGRWGPGCVRRLRGMFAFAIWDARREELFLARDRLGIKPLYYRQDGPRFLFASQVRTLLATGLVPLRVSAAGLRTFLEYGAVGDPLTAVDGVLSLPAAHTATLRGDRLELERYWAPPEEANGSAGREEAERELERTLEDVVRRHLASDAPLGLFLSGGIDSSVLAALAARHTDDLRTVSVVFDDAAYSEADAIRLVAQHVGSRHVEIDLDPADLLPWLDDAFEAMDQPSYDGINAYVVSRAAATTGLKVALSGLGGDELFDGYGYLRRVTALERAARVPAPLTRLATGGTRLALGGARGDKARDWLSGGHRPGASYALLRRVFLQDDVRRLCRLAEPDGLPPQPVVVRGRDLYNQISVLDLTNYTRNVLLRDTDAMSMASSLEVRVPLLDDVLVEQVLRLPGRVKTGAQKSLLVAATRSLLPPEIFTRPKQGFVLPFEKWMRGELRAEVEDAFGHPPALLAETLDASQLERVWRDYLRDGRRWTRPWALYALCHWAASVERATAAAQRSAVAAG